MISPASARLRALVLGPCLVLAVTASCARPPAAGAPGAPGAPETAPPRNSAPNATFGFVDFPEVPGRILLFDPARWQRVPGGSFSVLEHSASRSTLALRVWRAPRLVRPEECESEARLVRPSLPAIDPETLVDSRPLAAPAGFNGTLRVGVELAGVPERTPAGSFDPSRVRGMTLAVGASVGRCFTLAFETIAEGGSAASVVGERLRVVTDDVVPSLTLRGIDERAREPEG